jgi:hypothetical protein
MSATSQKGAEPMSATSTSKAAASGTAALWTLLVIDAALLITSGSIHLDLWNIAYRHVNVLGPLFLVQVIAAFVLAVGVLVTRHILAVVASLGLVIGTIIGFILVITIGLFNFKLPFISGEAWTTLIVEAVAIVTLTATGLLMVRRGQLASLLHRRAAVS